MKKIKKKGQAGVAATYVSRTKALKILQLSLAQFRDLCILKGIYPREPRNRKKAQKGKPQIQTLYHKKDMRFLLHEPLVWKFRAMKIYLRKLAKARNRKDEEAYRRVIKTKPGFKLDHLVKERYPTFVDAVRDLDDPLSMCCLYATFPKMYKLPEADKLSQLSRRLTLEFMLYVIEAKALRKVFVSIKGYYFQAEIAGQTVTWVMPHNVAYVHPHGQSVDFRVMNTFTEFYVYLFGFVNYRLYQQLNLCYPPKLQIVSSSSASGEASSSESAPASAGFDERISALNHPLRRNDGPGSAEDEAEAVALDEIQMDGEEDAEKAAAVRREAESAARLQNLFRGLKFFLNREVPREVLTFVVRACGGQVSWCSSTHAGATYDESDESITHQIVDRDDVRRPYLSRTYVQPQWVFDSINARERKPVEKYFPGVDLPAHLSPFYDYDVANADDDDGANAELEEMVEDEEEEEEDVEEEGGESRPQGADSGLDSDQEEEEEEEDEDDDEDEDDEEDEDREEDEAEEEEEDQPTKPKMTVSAGKYVPPNKALLDMREDREHFAMRKMMIPRKHRRLYGKMMARKKLLAKDERVLDEKRAQIAEFNKQARQQKKQKQGQGQGQGQEGKTKKKKQKA